MKSPACPAAHIADDGSNKLWNWGLCSLLSMFHQPWRRISLSWQRNSIQLSSYYFLEKKPINSFQILNTVEESAVDSIHSLHGKHSYIQLCHLKIWSRQKTLRFWWDQLGGACTCKNWDKLGKKWLFHQRPRMTFILVFNVQKMGTRESNCKSFCWQLWRCNKLLNKRLIALWGRVTQPEYFSNLRIYVFDHSWYLSSAALVYFFSSSRRTFSTENAKGTTLNNVYLGVKEQKSSCWKCYTCAISQIPDSLSLPFQISIDTKYTIPIKRYVPKKHQLQSKLCWCTKNDKLQVCV